jgi:signal transduction histidine kinase
MTSGVAVSAMGSLSLRRPSGFWSLRAKFVGFVSLIIIIVCSVLSGFFVYRLSETRTGALLETGTILVNDLAHASEPLLGNRDALAAALAGVMAVEDVVYAMVTAPDGERLAMRSKGKLTGQGLARSADAPLLPDPELARAAAAAPAGSPIVRHFAVHAEHTSESINDFALPVVARARAGETGPVRAVVQVGVTRVQMEQALASAIGHLMILTVMIILLGIAFAVLLADRIVTPLRQLARAAERLAAGDLSGAPQAQSDDEVGQLTHIFGRMTESLKERDSAISAHITTITRQVKQLSGLNHAGAALASTLDIDKLLTSVLQLLVEQIGFRRMALMLYDPRGQVAHDARVAGVPETVQRAASRLQLPVQEDGTLLADMLLHGRACLIRDLDAAAPRMHPEVAALAREIDVRSFISAPLKTSHHILGFIAADRSPELCTQEDLDLLTTIANHIAVALDNALAYRQLAQLTQTLEQRVEDRTQELQAANQKLLELDRLKSAFVSIVSHELRTPMTSIKGYVENMLDGLTGELTDKQAYYLGRVKYNAERLTRMINDLLDLSRIEAGRTELTLARVQVGDLLTDILEAFHPMAEAKALTLHARPVGDPVSIRGDRDKLHQILTNLIHNALKFTPPGGEILLETHPTDPGLVQFCVGDSGIGIPLHEHAKVFDRFYRGESVEVEQRGAGLGLAITKSLVELHGGRIWVESAPGKGSRFFFTIPRAL